MHSTNSKKMNLVCPDTIHDPTTTSFEPGKNVKQTKGHERKKKKTQPENGGSRNEGNKLIIKQSIKIE